MQVHQLEARYPYKPTGQMIDLTSQQYRKSFLIATEPEEGANYEEVRMFFTEDKDAIYFGCLKQGRPKGPPKAKIQGRIYLEHHRVLEDLADLTAQTVSYVTCAVMEGVLSGEGALSGLQAAHDLMDYAFMSMSSNSPELDVTSPMEAVNGFCSWISSGGAECVRVAIGHLNSVDGYDQLVDHVASFFAEWLENNTEHLIHQQTACFIARNWLDFYRHWLPRELGYVLADMEG